MRETETELGDVMGTPEEPKPGPLPSVFRNASLERVLPGLRTPHARKTGTTIAGIVFRVSRVLGLGGLIGEVGGSILRWKIILYYPNGPKIVTKVL